MCLQERSTHVHENCLSVGVVGCGYCAPSGVSPPRLKQTRFPSCFQPRMDQYFNQMEKIVKERKTSSRIRFMLQDVIDLRLVSVWSTFSRPLLFLTFRSDILTSVIL